jgi:hypothetical protein
MLVLKAFCSVRRLREGEAVERHNEKVNLKCDWITEVKSTVETK